MFPNQAKKNAGNVGIFRVMTRKDVKKAPRIRPRYAQEFLGVADRLIKAFFFAHIAVNLPSRNFLNLINHVENNF